MKTRKTFTSLKTIPLVANVIDKVRSMQKLTDTEQLIYCIHVKGMTEELAHKFVDNKIKK